MTVRTKQLACGESAWLGNTYLTVYTCPVGYRTIVKDLRLFRRLGDVAGEFIVSILKSSGTRADVDRYQILNNLQRATNPVWVVLEEGDELQLYATTNVTYRYVISGTELDLQP